MYATAEIRWFSRGSIPEAVLAWFQDATAGNEPPEARVDQYLLVPDADSLGIKIRQNLLEFKLRTTEIGVIDLRERARGNLEQWQKWSLPLRSSDGEITEFLRPSENWIGVSKARHLRKYAVVGKTECVAISVDEYTKSGCEVELTVLQVSGQTWWTFAFESFGAKVALNHNLVLTAEHVLNTAGAPLLTPTQSYGYTHWLQHNATSPIESSE
jgi:hypothetical protein